MAPAPPHIRGTWRDDFPARAVYSEAAGIQQIVPRAIAVPADTDDVIAIVRWAAEAGISVTARGAGSSMAGAAVGPGIVVDLSLLNAIGRVDPSRRLVRVGPGAICAAVDGAARRFGLRFPVNPSSAKFCTVGGMAATNAAGASTLRFGPMRAWVEGLECVLADGSKVWIRRSDDRATAPILERFAGAAPAIRDAEHLTPTRHPGLRKESSGYGLDAWARSGRLVDLLIGSEGTLALFTALELRLAPIPAASGTIIAVFSSIEAAAAGAAVAAELNASACELLDRTFLEIARRGAHLSVPEDAEAVLLVDVEEDRPSRVAAIVRALATAFSDAGAAHVETALDDLRAAQLWRLRHAASPVLAALGTATISMQVIEDGAVPPARLPDYVRGVRRALAERGFAGVLFGHAGDGHIHANVLVDTAADDWRPRLEALFDDVVGLTASLGGTLAGEHGDGRLRAGGLSRMWSEASIARMHEIKRVFDPLGILNPGVKLPIGAAPSLGGPVKYDPALPPLPAAARRVLDRVQRERCWGSSRLALLADEEVR